MTAPDRSDLFLSRDAVRAIDRRAMAAGVPGPVLMENAARGVVDLLVALRLPGPVAVVCGKGNNAGDGFAIARHLHLLEIPVHIEAVVPAAALTGDAATAYAPLPVLRIPIFNAADGGLPTRLRRCAWILDALLGTGSAGPPRPDYAAAINTINETRSPARRVLAIDLPSGLNPETGSPQTPTTHADHTTTFVAGKQAFQNPGSAEYTGLVHVIPVGWR
ncbi:MAG: NAD(P)H-hydrate epimerase [Planctomycetia bacterium]